LAQGYSSGTPQSPQAFGFAICVSRTLSIPPTPLQGE
jgi:hypothetical protein